MGEPEGKPALADSEVIEIEGERFLDPFDIPASYAGRLDPGQYRAVFDIIEAKHGDLLQQGFRDPEVRALLLCDGEVVARARTPEEIDLDEIRQIEEKHDRLCFIYGKEDLIEECGWSRLDSDDAYPTLRVWLGPDSVDPSELQGQGREVVADFDTGNPRHPDGFFAFDDAIRTELALRPGVPGRARHMGGRYEYTRSRVRVGAADENSHLRSDVADARFVSNWASTSNPFRWANPQRRGFVGREIMFALGLSISLDAGSRRTRVEFV